MREQTVQGDEIQTAVSLHDEGVNGNKSAVQQAYKMFKSLHEKEPNNPEIASYFGSASALMGRDEENLTKRMKYSLTGLKILDAVVEKSPDFVLSHWLRGNVCYRLPEMYFHRTETAVEDFKYLDNLYEQDQHVLTKLEYETLLKNLIKACDALNRTEESMYYREKFKALLPIPNPNEKSNDKSFQTNPVNHSAEAQPGLNQSTETLTELDEESFQIYQKALQGERTDVENAIKHFSSLETIYPNNPLIKAYSIDCNSLLGRDSNNTFEMFSAGIKSMKALDALVNEHPNNVKIKKIRAYQSFRLPESFFRKTASAIQDYEELIRQYKKEPTLFTSEEYMEMLFYLGEGYARLGMNDEAYFAWDKILLLEPSTETKQKVKEKQNILEFKPIKRMTFSETEPEKLFKLGKEIHEIGAKGSKLAALQALDLWEIAAELFPDNSTAKTYYAASVALMAKYSDEAQGMFHQAIKGLKLLKSALDSNDSTAELRLLRGYIYYSLPEAFFHKTDSAIKDFKAAKSLYKQGDQSISREQFLQLLADLGTAYARSHFQDKAQKTWNLLAKEDTDGQYKEFLESKGVVKE